MNAAPSDPDPHPDLDRDRVGQVAVIFVSWRRVDPDGGAHDGAGYDAAADALDRLAARQPGYRGHVGARGADGCGVTISWWADDAAACAWRDHAEHAAIRAAGREQWYDRYEVGVARVERGYRWTAS